ncbi:hypothetical protein FANTH_5115 [Fusarium anthophilum]|uniref:Uncharacterized protein n=1 Tax=Fusarium anthophilum TaxID=48485 RepID=A0A8H4ZNC6_9HYPO|nr:hypothetical protein FANTH_5115 [Fusarium anthophilum]
MPLPKTDEEIKASWSPQEWKFHAWEEKNIKNILDTQNRDAEWDAYSKLVKQAWPDRDEREKYLEWAHTWNGRIFVRNKYVMNTEDYIEMISQANFLDMDKVNRISRNIPLYPMPFVAIGEAHFGRGFSGYAFTPVTDFLEPKYPDSDSDALGNMMLALNINVPHSPPLSPENSVYSFDSDSDSNSSELFHTSPSPTNSQSQSAVWVESSDITRENSPDSATPNVDLRKLMGARLGFTSGPSSVFNDTKGDYLTATIPSAVEQVPANIRATRESGTQDFVFVQLGLLWTFTGDWKKARQGNPNVDKQGKWNPNGFAVVVRLSPKGEPGKVYALRHPNVVPQLEKIEDDLIELWKEEGNKKRNQKRGFMLKHYRPGHPHPKGDYSFWIAKIADSIQELGSYEREFEFDIVPSNEPQIVNAKIWIYELDGPALTPVREPDEIDI